MTSINRLSIINEQIIIKVRKKKNPKTEPQLLDPSGKWQSFVLVQSNIILYQSSPVADLNNTSIA